MPDVVEQLRSYGQAVERAVEPADRAAPRNRRPLLLAAAGLVVLAGVAGAAWLSRTGGEDDESPIVDTVDDVDGPATGWHTLDPGPLEPREEAAVVWTGAELVVWGGASAGTGQAHQDGAAYDPATGEWRMMSSPPIGGGGLVGGTWTGSEVLVWSAELEPQADDLPPWTVLAWNPATDTWRRAGGQCLTSGTPADCTPEPPVRPMSTRLLPPVWTGTEVVDVGIGWTYDPDADVWRPLPERPILGDPQAAVWAGDRMVVLVANRSDPSYPAREAVGLSFDPATDRWEALPPTGVGETAVDLAWDGQQVVALDHQMQASTYRVGDDRWTPLPPLPLRFYECSPRVAAVGDTVLAQHCSGEALLTADRQWAIAGPSPEGIGLPVEAGDVLFSWISSDYYGDPPGSVLRAYRPPRIPDDDLALERTVPVGTVRLDLPTGARLSRTDRGDEAGGLVTHIGFAVDLSGGDTCTLTSTYATIQSAIRIRNDASTVDARIGDFPLEGVDVGRDTAVVARFPTGALDAQAHVLLEESTSDVLDIACPTMASVEQLLERIHR